MMLFEQVENYGVYVGISILVAFMAFIVWDLAKQSNAGKWGTAVLFFALGLGVFGFIMKGIIATFLMP
jgi:Protein of unknown function (DUF2788)